MSMVTNLFVAVVLSSASASNKTVIAETRHLELPASPPSPVNKAAGAAGAALGRVAWQSAVVEGLAAFIASRTEAELSLWIVENFVGRLCPAVTDKDPKREVDETLLRAGWFPETCALLGTRADDAALPGSAMIAALREDVEQLPYALLKVYLGKAGSTKDEADALFDTTQVAAGTLVTLLRRGAAPVEAIARWADTPKLRSHCVSPGKTVAVLTCRMAMLGEIARWHWRTCGGDSLCVPTEPLDPSLAAELKKLTGEHDSLGAVQSYADFITWLAAHPRPQHGQTTRDHAKDVLARVIELVTEKIADADQQSSTQKVVLALETVRHALLAEYADAARGLVRLLDATLEQRDARAERDTLIELRRYALLVADLAAAKDSEAVRAALQSAAAPVGGWRIKRRRFTASLSALAGVAGSMEWLPAKRDVGATISPIAAVGLDLSGPVGRRGWTLGGFASILDLGQLVSARLSSRAEVTGEEGAKTASEVALLSVLSPGAYLRAGIGHTPLTFGAGIAYAPAMRTYFYRPEGEATDVIGDPFAAVRVSLFVAIDVTIFPFVRARRRGR